MPYMLLIVEPRGQRAQRTNDEGQLAYARMVAFGEGLAARGLLQGSNSLRSDNDAVRVRVRDGRRTLIDGPFAESKEMVGGYFILTCDDREQALEIAAACPAAEWATVEVREIAPCHVG
ncbi:MAG: YciI family protein [Ectothiorhodospiraceae bacterium]|jgi:hypothetical protein|nr:YciI family protein [Ectothiorhodospiraceae bacterium]